MSSNSRGLVLITAGAVLVLVALAADAIGLGGSPGFGWKQILGTLVGVGAAAAGIRDLRR